MSLLLPGFSQFYDSQLASGASYASLGLGSLYWQQVNQQDRKDFEEGQSYRSAREWEKENFYRHHVLYQEQVLSSQLYLFSGSLSAYRSFLDEAKTDPNYKFMDPSKKSISEYPNRTLSLFYVEATNNLYSPLSHLGISCVDKGESWSSDDR